MPTVAVYTYRFGPWEDGADEPPLLDTVMDEQRVDDLDGTIDMLRREGLTEPSSSVFQSGPRQVWWSAEAYVHPCTGEREEKSAHFHFMSDVDARKVWDALHR